MTSVGPTHRPPRLAGPALAALSGGLAGCDGRQSVLDAGGPAGAEIARIAWIMFVGGGVIFALVVAILAFVLLRRHDAPRRLPAKAFIVAGGVVLPVVTLTLLLAYTLRVGATYPWRSAGPRPRASGGCRDG